MQHERKGIDGAGDEVRARAGSLERRGEGDTAGALAVEADGEARRLADLADEVRCPLRAQRARRVVNEDARGAELGQPLRLLGEQVGVLACGSGCARGLHRTPVPRR